MENKPKAFGAAKSVIMLFLQGGPSHIDIWDPKPDAPANIRGDFKAIKTKVPGIEVSEVMPMLADQMDKVTLIRSMSYTPVGPVQPHRRHLSDDDGLSAGQSVAIRTAGTAFAARFPAHGLPHLEDEAARGPHAAVRGDAAPAAGIERHRQRRRRRIPGQGYDPYRLYQDPNKESSWTISRCAPMSRRIG